MNSKTTPSWFRAAQQRTASFETKCIQTMHLLPVSNLQSTANKTLRCSLAALLVLLSFFSPALAQTYTTTTGTSNNIYPFGSSTSNNKVQWLYTPSDFTTTVPTGSITKLYFRTFSSTYSATYSNFTIRMGTTTMTAFPSASFITGLTTVYSATSHAVPSTGPYTWFLVTLSSPFFYNAGDNLIIEIEHNGITAGSITTSHVSPGTNRRIWGNYGSTSGSLGSTMGDLGLDVLTGPPCPSPSSPAVSNKTSTSATLTWGAASPSVGYSYVISTSATAPSSGFLPSTLTTVNATGLTPSTTYYLHVRNNCSGTNWSPWVSFQFQTNPPCSKRTLTIKDVTTKSASIKWNKEAHGTKYEYLVKKDTTTPTTGTTITTDTTLKIDKLPEGTKYYVFVRMHCPGGELSPWALDSFTTRTVCRPPSLNVTHLDASRAVVYWEAMPTAVNYEYEISQSPTPLGKGTTIQNTSFLAFPLKDGNVYYFHVKSKCVDQGFISESDWATTSFRTFSTSVSTTSNNLFVISAYPNPVNDQLTINISGQIKGDASLIITDMNGRTVHTAKIESMTTTIDMTKLPSGLYLVKYSDAGYSEVIKITKR